MASDLSLHYLPTSHKKGARLIWVKKKHILLFEKVLYYRTNYLEIKFVVINSYKLNQIMIMDYKP